MEFTKDPNSCVLIGLMMPLLSSHLYQVDDHLGNEKYCLAFIIIHPTWLVEALYTHKEWVIYSGN